MADQRQPSAACQLPSHGVGSEMIHSIMSDTKVERQKKAASGSDTLLFCVHFGSFCVCAAISDQSSSNI